MNGGMRSCFKLCSDSILSKFTQNIQPEMAKQRLYSTFWRTISPKPMVVNSFKSTLERSFSSSSIQFATEKIRNSPVDKKLLEYVEEKMGNKKEKTDATCSFEKKVDKSYLIYSKSFTDDETIAVKFNTNHYVKVEDYKEPIDNGDSKPFKYKINPNFRVEITRGGATLGLDCIIQDDHSNDGYTSAVKHDTSPDDDYMTYRGYRTSSNKADDDNCNQKKTTIISKDNEQCQDTSMFIIRNYAYYEGELNENTYQCCGVGNERDAAMYNIMKNLLREKGICNKFLSDVILHSKVHESCNHSCFIQNLEKFMKGETVLGTGEFVAILLTLVCIIGGVGYLFVHSLFI